MQRQHSDASSPGTETYRIVVVTHYFSTHLGGVESVAWQLARRIVEDPAFEATWLASDCDTPPDMPTRMRALPMRSWNFMERRSGLPWPVWGFGSLVTLKREIAEANIVHLHDFIYFGSLAAYVFAKWHRTPVLITQHIGDIPFRSAVLRGILKGLNRTLGSLVLSGAERVVFYSEIVRAQFARYCRFRSNPLFAQPNGVEPSLFHPLEPADRIALRSRLASRPKRTICLFVGRYVEKKGLPIMRELARRFDEVEWWFLGWGATTPEFDPETWGLPNVRPFANRSGASLAELYMASDLFVLPSKGEGFPLAVMESMACGTPALISAETAAAVPSVRDHVFICDADDPPDFERWVDTLADLLLSGAIVQRRTDVARFAAEHWTWEQCVAEYRAAYLQLVASPALTAISMPLKQ